MFKYRKGLLKSKAIKTLSAIGDVIPLTLFKHEIWDDWALIYDEDFEGNFLMHRHIIEKNKNKTIKYYSTIDDCCRRCGEKPPAGLLIRVKMKEVI